MDQKSGTTQTHMFACMKTRYMTITEMFNAGDVLVATSGSWGMSMFDNEDDSVSIGDIFVVGGFKMDIGIQCPYIELFHISGRVLKVYRSSAIWTTPRHFVKLHEDQS